MLLFSTEFKLKPTICENLPLSLDRSTSTFKMTALPQLLKSNVLGYKLWPAPLKPIKKTALF